MTAWKDIYGFQIGKELAENEIPKSQLFSTTIKNLPTSIINAEREEHQRYRRALSHGFSDSSMRAQEGIIMKYIDKLISRLHENCDRKEAPINVEAWYNWTTFDIAGDLIFAQSFGCLDRSDYHPWIAFIFKTIRYNAIMTAMKYIGLDPIVQGLFRIGGLAAMMQLRESTDKMMQTRLDMDPDRKDLFEGLLRKKEEWACNTLKVTLRQMEFTLISYLQNLSFEQLSANGLILVLAGSETTATTLAGTTYLLLRNPKILQKLNEEVRSSFTDSSEITINSVSKLSYMLAILNEALRMYPPVTSNLIREVPQFGCQIGSEHVPQGVSSLTHYFSILGYNQVTNLHRSSRLLSKFNSGPRIIAQITGLSPGNSDQSASWKPTKRNTTIWMHFRHSALARATASEKSKSSSSVFVFTASDPTP